MPAPERPRAAAHLRTAASARPASAGAVSVLASGPVRVLGRLPWSSNLTFLAEIGAGPAQGEEGRGQGGVLAVYKPVRGERPLADFPPGLHRREAAAFELAVEMGLRFVPETVVRPDGPYGEGSLQLFVDVEPDANYFTLVEDEHYRAELAEIAAFDLVANNADRKAGHVLLLRSGRCVAVDHGLCFHVVPKLRTVMWDFVGEPIPDGILEGCERLLSGDVRRLAALLTDAELAATRRRARALLERPRFPAPPEGRRPYPWPLV